MSRLKPLLMWALWVGVVSLLSGCSTLGPFGAKQLPVCNGEVYLVRGAAGYWPSADSLADKMACEGISATVVFGWEVDRLADRIAFRRRIGRASGPLVLLGYSLGANDAIKLSRQLKCRNVEVDSLVLLEMTFQDVVPSNVNCCFNMYESRPATDFIPAFRGIPVRAESESTRLVNLDVRQAYPRETFACDNHFTIHQNPLVQSTLLAQTRLALQPASRFAAPLSGAANSGPMVTNRLNGPYPTPFMPTMPPEMNPGMEPVEIPAVTNQEGWIVTPAQRHIQQLSGETESVVGPQLILQAPPTVR